MKLASLLNDNFHLILKDLKSQKIPVKAAYALKDVGVRIEKELIKYEEMRKELLIRYGSKNDNNELIISEDDSVLLDEQGQLNFMSAMNELLNVEINIGSVSVADLGDDVKLSVNDLIILDGLIN